MTQVKTGDIVRVHYTAKLEDDTVIDSSLEREPLEFCTGQGMVIPGFDNAVIGMKEGEAKTVSIPPEEAYGDYKENLRLVIKKSHLPPDIEPKMGMMLHGKSEDGMSINATVKKIKGELITLDANHPLAGKTLIYEIQVIGVG